MERSSPYSIPDGLLIFLSLGTATGLGFAIALLPLAGVFWIILALAAALSVILARRFELVMVLVLVSSLMPEVSLPSVFLGLKLTPDLAAMLLSIGLWLIYQFLESGKRPERVFYLGRLTLPLLVFSTVILFSMIFSPYGAVPLVKGLRMLVWFLIWPNLLVSTLTHAKKVKQSLFILVYSIGFLSLLALVDVVRKFSLTALASQLGRLTGVMGLATGEYLGFCVVVVAIYWIFAARLRTKLWLGILLIFFLILLLFAQARMAFVSTFIALFIIFWRLPARTRFRLSIAIVPILVLIFGIFVLPEQSRYHSLLNPESILVSTSSSEYSSWTRALLWQRSLEIARQYPILGVGPGMDATAIGMSFGRSTLLNAHNMYLTVLVETGVFGLMAFIWVMGTAWLLLYRALPVSRGNPELHTATFAMLGAITFALFVGITGGYLKGGQGTFFATQIALAAACIKLARNPVD